MIETGSAYSVWRSVAKHATSRISRNFHSQAAGDRAGARGRSRDGLLALLLENEPAEGMASIVRSCERVIGGQVGRIVTALEVQRTRVTGGNVAIGIISRDRDAEGLAG